MTNNVKTELIKLLSDRKYPISEEGDVLSKESARRSNNMTAAYNDCHSDTTTKLAGAVATEKNIEAIIIDYFGYKDIAEPVYNMRYGCSLTQALTKEFIILRKEGK